MSDEQGQEAEAVSAPGNGADKQAKSFGRRANSNLRAARRSLEAVDWQPDERARHLVAEANVLALLELADAIRGAKGA
jgi:hypothetical protein